MSAMSIETISNAVCESSRRGQHRLRNAIGIRQHVGMRFGRADGADDAFADAGDDRLFGRSADQLIQVRPHRDAGFDFELNAVLGHGVERFCLPEPRARAVDHFGIDARLHGFEHVAAGQVDGRGQLEIEVDRLGLVGGDDRADHQRHVAAGQVVGFERLAGDAGRFAQAGLHGHDLAAHDHLGIDLAEGHAQADRKCRSPRCS